jgi:hypothetical protein
MFLRRPLHLLLQRQLGMHLNEKWKNVNRPKREF